MKKVRGYLFNDPIMITPDILYNPPNYILLIQTMATYQCCIYQQLKKIIELD